MLIQRVRFTYRRSSWLTEALREDRARVLLHECSHIAAARLLKVSVWGITIKQHGGKQHGGWGDTNTLTNALMHYDPRTARHVSAKMGLAPLALLPLKERTGRPSVQDRTFIDGSRFSPQEIATAERWVDRHRVTLEINALRLYNRLRPQMEQEWKVYRRLALAPVGNGWTHWIR